MRALGKEGDSPGGIIEILDDETSAFGNRASESAPRGVVRDHRGRRWVAPVAMLAFAAMIVAGIVTSQSSSGAPQVAQSTTSLAGAVHPVPTTQPTATTVADTFPVPYYDADPPRNYHVQQASIQLADSGAYYGAAGYQLWTTDGSAASAGRWFSVQSFLGAQDFHVPDAYRVQTDQRPIAISHTASGQSIAMFSIERSATVQLTSFGNSDEELIRLAQSITFANGTVQVADPSVVSDYELTSTVMPWLAVQGVPVERTFYAPLDDLGVGVRMAIGLPAVVNDGDNRIDRQLALRYFLAHPTSFTVDGRAAVAGEVVGQNGLALASWAVDDYFVTLSGNISVPDLITIARSVHEVSPERWDGMKFQATSNAADVNRLYAIDAVAQPTPVSSGIDDKGNDWAIQAAVASYGNQHQITWMWDEHGPTSWTSLRDNTAQISPVVSADRTFVLADLPRSIATTAQLRVTRPGSDPVTLPFTDIDPGLDRTFAAYVFSEPGPYDAEVVGADGTLLATWPGP